MENLNGFRIVSTRREGGHSCSVKENKKKKSAVSFSSVEGEIFKGGGRKKILCFSAKSLSTQLRSRLQLCCSAVLKLLLGGDGEMNAPVNSVWQPDIKALKAEGHS